MDKRYKVTLDALPIGVTVVADSPESAIKKALEEANEQFEKLMSRWKYTKIEEMK